LPRSMAWPAGYNHFISHKPALPNLDRTREVGLEAYLEEQGERRLLLEHLLDHYNEGRSMSFYCAACALMPPGLIRQAIGEMEEMLADKQIDGSDLSQGQSDEGHDSGFGLAGWH
jgi:hypothetical protein